MTAGDIQSALASLLCQWQERPPPSVEACALDLQRLLDPTLVEGRQQLLHSLDRVSRRLLIGTRALLMGTATEERLRDLDNVIDVIASMHHSLDNYEPSSDRNTK